jgi:hypothetical protein
MIKNRLWVGTRGNVTCDEHAGVYLKSEISNNPNAENHITPLDWWVLYSQASFPCETCKPWNEVHNA